MFGLWSSLKVHGLQIGNFGFAGGGSPALMYTRYMFSEISLSPRNSQFRGQAVFSEKLDEYDKDFRREVSATEIGQRSLSLQTLHFDCVCDFLGKSTEIHSKSSNSLLCTTILQPPIISTCPLHTTINSGCGKREAHINWSMVTCKGSTRYSNYLEDYWPGAGGLSAVNAIGTQLRESINPVDPICDDRT